MSSLALLCVVYYILLLHKSKSRADYAASALAWLSYLGRGWDYFAPPSGVCYNFGHSIHKHLLGRGSSCLLLCRLHCSLLRRRHAIL